MIECLGRAYRKSFPDCESDEELEEGLENSEKRSVDSEILQKYMANQAQMIAGRTKDEKGN